MSNRSYTDYFPAPPEELPTPQPPARKKRQTSSLASTNYDETEKPSVTEDQPQYFQGQAKVVPPPLPRSPMTHLSTENLTRFSGGLVVDQSLYSAASVAQSLPKPPRKNQVYVFEFACEDGGLGISLGVGRHDPATWRPKVEGNGVTYCRKENGTYFKIEEIDMNIDVGLREGDEVLEINGCALEKLSLDSAGILLEEAARSGRVRFAITRTMHSSRSEVENLPGSNFEQESNNVNTDELGSFGPIDVNYTNQNIDYKTDDNLVCVSYSEPFEIELVKEEGGRSLGIGIVGGADAPRGPIGFFIKTIYPNGLVAEDGQLKIGDEILTLNGVSLSGLTHGQAITRFQQLAYGSILLTVRSLVHQSNPKFSSRREINKTLPGGINSDLKRTEPWNDNERPEEFTDDLPPPNWNDGATDTDTVERFDKVPPNATRTFVLSESDSNDPSVGKRNDTRLSDIEYVTTSPNEIESWEQDFVAPGDILRSYFAKKKIEEIEENPVNETIQPPDEFTSSLFIDDESDEDISKFDQEGNNYDDVPDRDDVGESIGQGGTAAAAAVWSGRTDDIKNLEVNVPGLLVPEGFEDDKFGDDLNSGRNLNQNNHDDDFFASEYKEMPTGEFYADAPPVRSGEPDKTKSLTTGNVSYGVKAWSCLDDENNMRIVDQSQTNSSRYVNDVNASDLKDEENNISTPPASSNSAQERRNLTTMTDNQERKNAPASHETPGMSDSYCKDKLTTSTNHILADNSMNFQTNSSLPAFDSDEKARFRDTESAFSRGTSSTDKYNVDARHGSLNFDARHGSLNFDDADLEMFSVSSADISRSNDDDNSKIVSRDARFRATDPSHSKEISVQDTELDYSYFLPPPPEVPEIAPNEFDISDAEKSDVFGAFPLSSVDLISHVPDSFSNGTSKLGMVSTGDVHILPPELRDAGASDMVVPSDIDLPPPLPTSPPPLPSTVPPPLVSHVPQTMTDFKDDVSEKTTLRSASDVITRVPEPSLPAEFINIQAEDRGLTEVKGHDSGGHRKGRDEFNSYVSLIQQNPYRPFRQNSITTVPTFQLPTGNQYIQPRKAGNQDDSKTSGQVTEIFDGHAMSGQAGITVSSRLPDDVSVKSDQDRASCNDATSQPDAAKTLKSSNSVRITAGGFSEKSSTSQASVDMTTSPISEFPRRPSSLETSEDEEEKARRRRKEGEPFQAVVAKNSSGLGLKISSTDDGTMITDVEKIVTVGRTGNVRVGDYLLAVNGIKLSDKTEQEVDEILRILPFGPVRLTLSTSHNIRANSVQLPPLSSLSTGGSSSTLLASQPQGGATSATAGSFMKSRKSIGTDEVVGNVLKDYYAAEENHQPEEKTSDKPKKPIIAQALLPKAKRSSSLVYDVASVSSATPTKEASSSSSAFAPRLQGSISEIPDVFSPEEERRDVGFGGGVYLFTSSENPIEFRGASNDSYAPTFKIRSFQEYETTKKGIVKTIDQYDISAEVHHGLNISMDNSKSLTDNFKSLMDNSKSLTNNSMNFSKSLIDNSKSSLDNSKSLTDNSKSLTDNSNCFSNESLTMDSSTSLVNNLTSGKKTDEKEPDFSSSSSEKNVGGTENDSSLNSPALSEVESVNAPALSEIESEYLKNIASSKAFFKSFKANSTSNLNNMPSLVGGKSLGVSAKESNFDSNAEMPKLSDDSKTGESDEKMSSSSVSFNSSDIGENETAVSSENIDVAGSKAFFESITKKTATGPSSSSSTLKNVSVAGSQGLRDIDVKTEFKPKRDDTERYPKVTAEVTHSRPVSSDRDDIIPAAPEVVTDTPLETENSESELINVSETKAFFESLKSSKTKVAPDPRIEIGTSSTGSSPRFTAQPTVHRSSTTTEEPKAKHVVRASSFNRHVTENPTGDAALRSQDADNLSASSSSSSSTSTDRKFLPSDGLLNRYFLVSESEKPRAVIQPVSRRESLPVSAGRVSTLPTQKYLPVTSSAAVRRPSLTSSAQQQQQHQHPQPLKRFQEVMSEKSNSPSSDGRSASEEQEPRSVESLVSKYSTGGAPAATKTGAKIELPLIGRRESDGQIGLHARLTQKDLIDDGGQSTNETGKTNLSKRLLPPAVQPPPPAISTDSPTIGGSSNSDKWKKFMSNYSSPK